VLGALEKFGPPNTKGKRGLSANSAYQNFNLKICRLRRRTEKMLRLTIAAAVFLFFITLMIDDSAAVKPECSGDYKSFQGADGYKCAEYAVGEHRNGFCSQDEGEDKANKDLPVSKVCWQCETCADPCESTESPCGIRAECEVADEKAVCSCPQGLTGDPLVQCGCSDTSECKNDQYCNSQHKCVESENKCGVLYGTLNDQAQARRSDKCNECENHPQWDQEDGKSFCNTKCDSGSCGVCEFDINDKKCVTKGCKSMMHPCCDSNKQGTSSCDGKIDSYKGKEREEKIKALNKECKEYLDAKKNLSC